MKPISGVGNALAAAIGAAVFFIVVGPRALDPSNIAWLSNGDPATHYLGWEVFRNSAWAFPVGSNPDYGLEISNAIVYSDSLALLAIPFKAFGPLLPQPFQYFGLWLLLCFAFQGSISWQLARLATDSLPAQLLITVLFSFSPPMLVRLAGHLSLAGHFLILAALYLNLVRSERNRRIAWLAVLAASALVHAYILAMTLVLWMASLCDQVANGDKGLREASVDAGLSVAVVAFALWQGGFFSVSDGVGSIGYGYYRMNALSPIDPSGWSYLLKDLPKASGDGEGFNFFGLGVIFLMLCSVAGAASAAQSLAQAMKRHKALALSLVALTAFALTNNLGFGTTSLSFPLPSIVEGVTSTLRASGRMFWPVFYALLFLAAWITCRAYGTRRALALLGIATALQVSDTSAGWLKLRQQLMPGPSSRWPTTLVSDFWDQAAQQYKKVVWLPPGNHTRHWQIIAEYAGRNGLATNAVYLARVDKRALARARDSAHLLLSDAAFSNDTLYLIDETQLLAAAVAADPTRDLLAKVDGFVVVAPGWKLCQSCGTISNEIRPRDLLPVRLAEGRLAVGTKRDANSFLAAGWSQPEDWGVWSESRTPEIVLPNSGAVHAVELEGWAFLAPPKVGRQRVEVSVNGKHALYATLRQGDGNVLRVPIPEDVRMDGNQPLLRIKLRLEDAARPSELGVSDDQRLLAFGLKAISLVADGQ